ncbi:MAG: hypothetical protein JRC86_09360 [Deltaproteobacteria bacterium]|nr:hypothetical protein [Deltaproteobacteria bacterium]
MKLSFEEADLMWQGALYAIIPYHHKYNDWEVHGEVYEHLEKATGWTLKEIVDAKPKLTLEERLELKKIWDK